jgi:hypothetical protein
LEKGATKEVKLTLDADAAQKLLAMAGSPRKQGDFVSRLIHAAASQPELLSGVENADVEQLRQMVYRLSQDVASVQGQLAQIRAALSEE